MTKREIIELFSYLINDLDMRKNSEKTVNEKELEYSYSLLIKGKQFVDQKWKEE